MKSLFYFTIYLVFLFSYTPFGMAKDDEPSNQIEVAKFCMKETNKGHYLCKAQRLQVEKLEREAREAESKSFRVSCNEQYKDYITAIGERNSACSDVGLGSLKCHQQVLACEGVSNSDKREETIRRSKKVFCALTPVKKLGKDRKTVLNYDEKYGDAKKTVEDLTEDIEEQTDELTTLQNALEDAQEKITEFTDSTPKRSKDKLDEIGQRAILAEGELSQLRQDITSLQNTTSLNKDSADQKIAELDAECGQKAAAEFKRSEIEYQKEQARKINSGQYKTNGFGLFFGSTTQGSSKNKMENLKKRREWLNYLKTECKLDEGVVLRKKQLNKAKEEAQKLANGGYETIQQQIKSKEYQIQKIKNQEVPEAQEQYFKDQQRELRKLFKEQRNAETKLDRAQKKLQLTQKNLFDAQNDMINNQRSQNTLEQSITDIESKASEEDVDPDTEAKKISLVFERVNNLAPIVEFTGDLCGCNSKPKPEKSTAERSATEQAANFTLPDPPRDNQKCSALKREIKNNQSRGSGTIGVDR